MLGDEPTVAPPGCVRRGKRHALPDRPLLRIDDDQFAGLAGDHEQTAVRRQRNRLRTQPRQFHLAPVGCQDLMDGCYDPAGGERPTVSLEASGAASCANGAAGTRLARETTTIP